MPIPPPLRSACPSINLLQRIWGPSKVDLCKVWGLARVGEMAKNCFLQLMDDHLRGEAFDSSHTLSVFTTIIQVNCTALFLKIAVTKRIWDYLLPLSGSMGEVETQWGFFSFFKLLHDSNILIKILSR